MQAGTERGWASTPGVKGAMGTTGIQGGGQKMARGDWREARISVVEVGVQSQQRAPHGTLGKQRAPLQLWERSERTNY